MTTKQILALIAIVLALLSIGISVYNIVIYIRWVKALEGENKNEKDE